MSERPSPYRIGVCALIAMYSDPNSPLNDLLASSSSSSAAFDDLDPTPSTNANNNKGSVDAATQIASFIEISVISQNGGACSTYTTSSLSTWLHDLYNIDLRYFSHTTGNDSEEYDYSGAAQLVLETLRLAAESIDALVDLMESLRGAVHHDGLVDADSVNGLFLRQVCLGFDELSFESVTLFWKAFQQEVSNCSMLGSAGNTRGNDVAAVTRKDHSNNSNKNLLAWDWPPSTEQLHEIIRRDCVEFQHDFNVTTSTEYRDNSSLVIGAAAASTTATEYKTVQRRRKRCSFEEMELYIRRMLEKEPELPVAYFLRYLNCLRHGERVGALDALHQYFDHAMVQHVPSRQQLRRGTSLPSSPVSSDILQFSAILLAMTHSAFGDSDLALMATEEAVRVAQQSKDSACVAFALGWLYEHTGNDDIQRRQLLERCATRASAAGISAAAANAKPGQPHLQHLHQQHQMSQAAQAIAIRAQQLRPLVSGAHQLLARHDLRDDHDNSSASNAGRIRTSAYVRAWSNLLEVSSEPSAEPGTVDRPTHLTPHPSDTRSSLARQQLISAAIWDAVGMPALSSWATKATLSSLPHDLSYDDMVMAIQNISRLALYGTPSHPSCIYSIAVGALVGLRKELGIEGNALEETILLNLALTLHEWAVNRMEIDDASALQITMQSYLHPGLANYEQFRADIKLQQCLYYFRLRNWDAAKAAARKGLEISEKAGFVNSHARFLLHTSIIHLESNQMHCATALQPLLDALTLCEERDMHSLHALGISILAQVFLRFCNPERAIALLDASIPTLLQREHVWFQAEAYRTLAKAHMNIAVNAIKLEQQNDSLAITVPSHMATGINNSGKDPTRHLSAVSDKRYRRALQALKKSEILYELCHDCIRLQEILYLQSQVYHLLNDEERRETAAERFVQVSKHITSSAGGDDHERNGSSKSCKLSAMLDALNDPIQLEALTKRVII